MGQIQSNFPNYSYTPLANAFTLSITDAVTEIYFRCYIEFIIIKIFYDWGKIISYCCSYWVFILDSFACKPTTDVELCAMYTNNS
jgi:hypothetical protein